MGPAVWSHSGALLWGRVYKCTWFTLSKGCQVTAGGVPTLHFSHPWDTVMSLIVFLHLCTSCTSYCISLPLSPEPGALHAKLPPQSPTKTLKRKRDARFGDRQKYLNVDDFTVVMPPLLLLLLLPSALRWPHLCVKYSNRAVPVIVCFCCFYPPPPPLYSPRSAVVIIVFSYELLIQL